MRVLWFFLLVVCLGSASAHKSHTEIAWTAQVPVGRGVMKKVIIFGGNPQDVLQACLCVSGEWTLGKNGETKTHFTGTLASPSFNHTRGAKPKTFKIRKTKKLGFITREHREKVLDVLRASGPVVLKEVTGGEWELIGYAPEPVGDLFGKYPRWRVDAKDPPKPDTPTKAPNPKADGVELARIINEYRKTLDLPAVTISPALTKVAEAHVRDLNVNRPVSDGCNMHSWSANGKWSACCYDKSTAAAKCMWAKPKEIAGYKGNGYEIAAGSPAGMTPELALSQWQGSPAHHEVMINRGIWKKPWLAMGVAVEGDFAVAWFGEQSDK